jgi:hypothetical protein
MKIDVVISLDQELTYTERQQLHFQHGHDLPDPDGVIEIIPPAPNGWLGRLPRELGLDLSPLVGAEQGLLIAGSVKDLMDAETVLLQGFHDETGIAFLAGNDRFHQLPHGRRFTTFRMVGTTAAELPELALQRRR